MPDAERHRGIERILDAAIPDRAERCSATTPIRLRCACSKSKIRCSSRRQVPNTNERASLLRAIRAELGVDAAVRFTP